MRIIPWVAVAVVVLIAGIWATRRRRTGPTPSANPVVASPRTYDEAIAALTAPAGAAAAPDGVAALEVGGKESPHLVLALPGDVVSLYLHGGPSIHGAGAIPEVRSAADAFRAALASHRDALRLEPQPSPPEPGWAILRTRANGRALSVRLPLGEQRSNALADALAAGTALQDTILEHAE